VTVCLATICNNGENLVCAADGMLSDPNSAVSGDVGASKMLFLDNWAFILSGTLSNGDLILEELRLMALAGNRKAKLGRENVRHMLARAYRTQLSNWLAERWLSQYNMDIDEFKKKGRAYLGEQIFSELSRSMEQDAANFNETVIVAGWGAAPHAANIFRIDRAGVASHTLDGFVAAGSGGTVAMSMLMQLWRGRHMITEDALYAVASAKFAAESCMGVGEATTICLLQKGKRPVFLQPPQLDELRRLWKRYGQPKIPNVLSLHRIAQEIGAGTNVGATREFFRAARAARRTERNS